MFLATCFSTSKCPSISRYQILPFVCLPLVPGILLPNVFALLGTPLYPDCDRRSLIVRACFTAKRYGPTCQGYWTPSRTIRDRRPSQEKRTHRPRRLLDGDQSQERNTAILSADKQHIIISRRPGCLILFWSGISSYVAKKDPRSAVACDLS